MKTIITILCVLVWAIAYGQKDFSVTSEQNSFIQKVKNSGYSQSICKIETREVVYYENDQHMLAENTLSKCYSSNPLENSNWYNYYTEKYEDRSIDILPQDLENATKEELQILGTGGKVSRLWFNSDFSWGITHIFKNSYFLTHNIFSSETMESASDELFYNVLMALVIIIIVVGWALFFFRRHIDDTGWPSFVGYFLSVIGFSITRFYFKDHNLPLGMWLNLVNILAFIFSIIISFLIIKRIRRNY